MKLLKSAVVVALLLLGGCGNQAEAKDKPETVRVFAAASLTDAFQALEAVFEEQHPAYDIELNLAGSSALRTQILNGAPVDVFASANQTTMDQVVSGGATSGDQRVFATNRLIVAVPAGNPASISGLDDLAAQDLFVGLCIADVPCGSLAIDALAAAGVTPSVDSFEPDVRALLTKLAEAELDVGLVYVTDVLAAESVVAVGDPIDIDAASYPIAVLDDATAADGAADFVEFVVSPSGQDILADFGFGQP